jgi:hypothetical protein
MGTSVALSMTTLSGLDRMAHPLAVYASPPSLTAMRLLTDDARLASGRAADALPDGFRTRWVCFKRFPVHVSVFTSLFSFHELLGAIPVVSRLVTPVGTRLLKGMDLFFDSPTDEDYATGYSFCNVSF